MKIYETGGFWTRAGVERRWGDASVVEGERGTTGDNPGGLGWLGFPCWDNCEVKFEEIFYCVFCV